MIWLVASALVPSCLVSWGVAHLVRRKAAAWGLLDHPGHRKVHLNPTPLGGGLAIWLGMLAPFACLQLLLWTWHEEPASRNAEVVHSADDDAKRPAMDSLLARIAGEPLADFVRPHISGLRQQSGKLWRLMGLGTVLVLLGLIDDRRGLDWRLRLTIEILVAAATVALGWRFTLYIDAPWLTAILSAMWIVALINSFNMLDNMDGLSGGVAAIAGTILACVLLFSPAAEARGPQLFVGGFLLVLVGGLLGFLQHNRAPARLFMGDAGAYFVGYCLATATIMATYGGPDLPRHAALAPLCVLAVPLYDMTTVVAIRLRDGRSPFAGDKSHFSHRLVELGMSKRQAVLTIYLASTTCGLGAFLLNQVNGTGAMIIVLLVACVLALIGVLETAGRRSRRSREGVGADQEQR